MKTALDLPDDLMKEVKITAVQHGKKLKDMISYLLRRGLDAEGQGNLPQAAEVGVDRLTGLPIVICRDRNRDAGGLTPSRIAEVLLEQEAIWANAAGR